MRDSRSLAIQSVVYLNEPRAVMMAARALANSCRRAVSSGAIDSWSYSIGDCSPTPALDDEDLAVLRGIVGGADGTFQYGFFDQNLGSAGGHNQLAASGAGAVLMILNPDAVVDPDTVAVLVEAMTADVGIAEARQIPLEHPKDYDPTTGDTGWSSTACAVTPRAVFDRLGGFDHKTFFLYCDDVDYSWRVRLEGMRVVYVPPARVFHDKRLTMSGDWPASSAEIYYSAEAALLLADKYSRPDLVDTLLPKYIAEGGAVGSAAKEYVSRKAAGLLAPPIDPDHVVGQFLDGNYVRHRF